MILPNKKGPPFSGEPLQINIFLYVVRLLGMNSRRRN